ncbi:hypothetical protein C8R44DRAFT_821494, partial [Mycena epipterygia]
MQLLCGIADDLIARSRTRAGMPASKRAQSLRPAVIATARPHRLRSHTSRVPLTPAPTSLTVPATPASKMPH